MSLEITTLVENKDSSGLLIRGGMILQGHPESNIILGFGRQLEEGRVTEGGQFIEKWSVFLPPDLRIKDRPDYEALRIKDGDWVIEISESFIRGYTANPDHSTTTIAIGTANANYEWNCDNNGLVDSLWVLAGQEWRNMIEKVSVSGNKVLLAGAIDIEPWDEVGDGPGGWVACGPGAVYWFDGYEFALPVDDPDKDYLSDNVLNFGNNGWAVYGDSQWTKFQVFRVFMGEDIIRGHPQIYCPGNIENDEGRDWVTIVSGFNSANVRFDGVTSDNAGSLVCGVSSMTWQQSWGDFYTALDEIDGLNDMFLRSSASSYYLPPLDEDMP